MATLKILGAVVISIAASQAGAAPYQMVSVVPGLQKSTPNIAVAKTCLDILGTESDVGSGVYSINPSGQNEISVHCDMTTAGGGWTMVQYREHEKPFSFTTDLGQHHSSTTKPYSYTLPDSEYLSIRSQSTDLQYKLLRTGAYGVVSLHKAQNVANCTRLGDSLAQFVLVHDETSGCTGTGTDYSNIGYRNYTYADDTYDMSSSIVNESGFFDAVSGDIPPSDASLRRQGALLLR